MIPGANRELLKNVIQSGGWIWIPVRSPANCGKDAVEFDLVSPRRPARIGSGSRLKLSQAGPMAMVAFRF